MCDGEHTELISAADLQSVSVVRRDSQTCRGTRDTFLPKSRGTKGSNKTQNDQHEKEREETDLFVHT